MQNTRTENKDEIAMLGVDACSYAFLDSACSSAVCGKFWLDDYLISLDNEYKTKAYRNDEVNVFKFGGGTLRSEGQRGSIVYKQQSQGNM